MEMLPMGAQAACEQEDTLDHHLTAMSLPLHFIYQRPDLLLSGAAQ